MTHVRGGSAAVLGVAALFASAAVAVAAPSSSPSPVAASSGTIPDGSRADTPPAISAKTKETGKGTGKAPGKHAPIFPLAQVKAGMIGEAWTVFSGTKPEPFKVKVVSVVENFMPKQNIILVKAEDPRVEFSGIAAGMSGSPVYIDGKLVGAIAYGWTFSKEPLAGVTPIETMLVEQARPLRDASELIAVPGGAGAPTAEAPAAAPASAPLVASATAPGAGPMEPQLRQVSVPLSISGLSPSAFGELGEALRPYGLVPLRSGGGGARRVAPPGSVKLEPGGMVGVQLIRGDMNASAMGTITHVDGNKVIAFGHPMFGIGEVSLPMVTGEVHTFIPSQASSFKLATPMVEVGALVQDRPSCIVGDLGKRATMMPVEVRVTSPGAEERVFRAEVARNRKLSPMLTSMVVTSAIADAEPDVTDMAVHMKSRVVVRGVGPVELRDQIFSTEGLSPRALAMSRGLRAVADLLANPFEPVTIDRVDVEVQVEFRKDVAEIVAVSLPGDSVKAGDTLPLRVTLRPYAGREYTETIPVTIPGRLAGRAVKVEVASGALVKPDVARPESLQGYIESLRSYYTASSIVVSLSLSEDGASLRGRLIPGLPQSALDTLRPGNQTRRADAYRLAERTVFSSPRLVQGRQELTVNVREDVLGRSF